MLNRTRNSVRFGFTLMELLVVIAIITMLIGILVPGMQGLSRIAKDLKQKSLFHSMEIGLELFRKDFDHYPISMTLPDPSAGSDLICGAQHLMEALVGRDLRGFEPVTNWYAPIEPPTIDDLYTDDPESLKRRKKLYIDLKDIETYEMRQIYADCGQVFPSTDDSSAPVFMDVYRKSPVLYFKANTESKLYKKEVESGDDISQWIYNYQDNEAILALNTVKDPTVAHELTEEKFYEVITNPKVATHDKPYNATTFILMTAGRDGIFGTKDDVTNFDK